VSQAKKRLDDILAQGTVQTYCADDTCDELKGSTKIAGLKSSAARASCEEHAGIFSTK